MWLVGREEQDCGLDPADRKLAGRQEKLEGSAGAEEAVAGKGLEAHRVAHQDRDLVAVPPLEPVDRCRAQRTDHRAGSTVQHPEPQRLLAGQGPRGRADDLAGPDRPTADGQVVSDRTPRHAQCAKLSVAQQTRLRLRERRPEPFPHVGSVAGSDVPHPASSPGPLGRVRGPAATTTASALDPVRRRERRGGSGGRGRPRPGRARCRWWPTGR